MKKIALRDRTYPKDLNHAGTVFGGWIMAKMDKAASIAVESIISSPAVTVNVTDLSFLKPIQNGDVITIYTDIVHVGNTSMKILTEVLVTCRQTQEEYKVTQATFTFVAVDAEKKPVTIKSVLRKKDSQE